MIHLIYSFRTKKYSNKRRESLVVHDIHNELGDAKEVSTRKVSFEDNSHGSLELEKSE